MAMAMGIAASRGLIGVGIGIGLCSKITVVLLPWIAIINSGLNDWITWTEY